MKKLITLAIIFALAAANLSSCGGKTPPGYDIGTVAPETTARGMRALLKAWKGPSNTLGVTGMDYPWRREWDLNPRMGISHHTISSRAP